MPVASVRLRRRSDRLWLLGAVLLLLLLSLHNWREPISERLVPDPGLNRKLERAHVALRRGELSRPDGGGARELYESVLATDPDHTLARQGLAAVREAAVARADAALRARRIEDARAALALAQGLRAPLPQLQPLRARLQALEEASVNVPALLARAAAPEVGDEEALALLGQVLAIDAGNEVALEGRRELFSFWLVLAEQEIEAGREAAARARIERVMAADPGHVELPPLRARLGELAATRERRRGRELARALADERAGRTARAAETYRRWRAESEEARAGLERLASREGSARADAPAARLPAASRSERARVPGLLADSREAMQRGDFLAPPGASAWDKLRVAAAIAPDSPEVRTAQREFETLSAECFAAAMDAGRLRTAQSCLEAWRAQSPTAPAAVAAPQALAERWLAHADERIGASDWAAAQAALDAARRLQPRHPQLQAAEARLRRARDAR